MSVRPLSQLRTVLSLTLSKDAMSLDVTSFLAISALRLASNLSPPLFYNFHIRKFKLIIFPFKEKVKALISGLRNFFLDLFLSFVYDGTNNMNGGKRVSLMRLRELMTQKGFTSDRLANASGVPKSTIDKIAAGFNTNPGLKTVRSLANALELSLDEMADLLDFISPLEESIAQAVTPEETKLLIRFRKLSPAAQASILQMMDVLIDNSSEKKL
jgi:transcriptional regulator with XRE-family HTH domain